ncbi:serine/threonine-protein kinase [Sphaerisporangium sp. NPDC005289]|uniref:serine/threonine-protein kinase n=1 Tax=Sphaerisporangium sp. NPDC005289 TaxID=3155247 RepID=UPI0033A57226
MDPLRDPDPREIGGFRLEGRLGQGGMGVVFLGVSPAGQRVAVKVIREGLLDRQDIRQRFAGEVKVLKAVYGSRIASLEKADALAEPPWLAVEFVPGETLDTHVRVRGPLAPHLVAILGATIAEGLATIHAEGLLHRDLKPHNIILGEGGPKLIDFGLAVLAERMQVITESGVPIGTPVCMAPEQARIEELTVATDVYALAATLLYALTGHYPFRADDVRVLIYRIGQEDIAPDLSGADGPLKELLAAMLAFAPAERPSLAEVTDRLVGIATEGGITVAEARTGLSTATFGVKGPGPEVVLPQEAEAPTELVASPFPLAGSQRSPGPIEWLSDRLRRSYARQPSL